jgi:methyltransferase, putative, TIGR00027 family
MQDQTASKTALVTAYLRAAHQLLDAKPSLLDDPVAVSLLGEHAAKGICETANRYQTPAAKALRSHVLLRSRFAEDRLALAVRRGITQYVLLGAGFDTFTLRQPSWARSLRIFELDHPATQAVKQEYIARAKLELPANTVCAQIDFEKKSLIEDLVRCRVSLKEPTFFSWLGVTMYLPEIAIDSVLRSISAFPSGSEVVLTFLQHTGSSVGPSSGGSSQLAANVASAGEPFISYFDPPALEIKLRAAGFSNVEFLSSAEAELSYFRQRENDLPVPKRTGIVSAII